MYFEDKVKGYNFCQFVKRSKWLTYFDSLKTCSQTQFKAKYTQCFFWNRLVVLILYKCIDMSKTNLTKFSFQKVVAFFRYSQTSGAVISTQEE